MKITMEERLRKWGFHEEDIPAMLEELDKLPSIMREEEIILAESAFQALMKVKLPNYDGGQGFYPKARTLINKPTIEVEHTYNWTIPNWELRLLEEETETLLFDQMTESDWTAVIDLYKTYIKRRLSSKDNKYGVKPEGLIIFRMSDNAIICLYLKVLKRISEEGFKRVIADEFIRTEILSDSYVVERLEL